MRTSIVAPSLADEIKRMADRIAELEAALRVLVDGYYSDDESVPTLEQWDTARELLKTK